MSSHNQYLHDVFISYSHKSQPGLSKAIERGLKRLLKSPLGRSALNVFRDESYLNAGHNGIEQILSNLSKSHWFLFLASPSSAESPWCKRELRWWLGDEYGAFNYTDDQLNEPIIFHSDKVNEDRLRRLLIARADGELIRNSTGTDWQWSHVGKEG